MSDDSDKTEEPTDHKLRKAKEEGNVPRSEDLNGFIGIVFVLLLLGVFYLMYPKRVSDEMGKCFQTMWSLALDKYSMTPECLTLVNTAVEMTYISFFAMIIAAFLAYFIMNKGFVIPKEPIKFNMQALDIGTNFTNLFNAQNVVGLAMSVFKEILFYGTLFLLVQYFLGGIVYETFCFENCSGVSAIYYILALILAYTLISFIFAAVDYPMKIHFWQDKLKMSHKDLKDEHKEMEGSPEIKHAQQDFRWEMMNGVPSGPKNATFFVGNGTTIWGIRYNREESPAPIIVAVGKKPEQVGRIARTAQQMRRLIIADDEFCKLLSGKAVMGRPVPLEYIAQVRRAIMELRKWEGQFGPVHPPKK